MKRTQLAAAVLLATGSVSAFAATYSVTLPLQDTARNNFARSIDNSGKMLSVVQLEFNPPIDAEQLEEDTTFFDQFGESLENEDDARQGVFTDIDYTTVVNYLLSNPNLTTGQKLASYRTYATDTQDISLVPGLDEVTDKFDDYTRSVESTGRDSLNGNFIVGDSSGLVVLDPYENEDGDTLNYTYPESAQQAFVQASGETKVLPAVDDTVGGFSSARAINANLQVAGFSTVSAMMLPMLLKRVQTMSLVVTHLKVAACLLFIMAILLFHVFLATSLIHLQITYRASYCCLRLTLPFGRSMSTAM